MVAETADTTLVLKERDTFLRQSPIPSISTTIVCEVKYNEPKQQKKKKKEEKKRKKSQSLMII